MGCCATLDQGLNSTGAKQSRRIAKDLGPGEQYTDPDFPPTDQSIFYDRSDCFKAWHQVVWNRAMDAFESPELFKGAASESVVEQGLLGNCWFISALSIIANRMEILRHLIVAQYPQLGIYEFRFFKEGRWVNVIIDDYLPFQPDGSLLFGHSTVPGQLWVPLIEKAYAKLHGSYQALSGGEVSYALVDLTGGASEYIRLDSTVGRSLQEKGWLVEKMRQCKAEAWLMGCSFRPSSQTAVGIQKEKAGANGQIAGHSYAMLDIADVQYQGRQVSLIKLRNPWGNKAQWQGPWGRQSVEWSESGRPFPQLPEEDGVFWMSYQDWVKNAAYFSICRTYRHNIGAPFYVITEPNGRWRGTDTGGHLSPNNPQYLVMAEKTTVAFVYLMQDDHRYMCQKGNYDYANKAIGMCFANAYEGKRLGVELFRPSCFLFGTHFICGRSIGADVVLEEGECYAVMPCLWEAGEQADYRLYVFSNHPVRMKKTTTKVKQEDEYDSVLLRSVMAKQEGYVWDPSMRNRIFNAASNLPARMETYNYALELDRSVGNRGGGR